MKLTYEYVRKLFKYDGENLIWNKSKAKSKKGEVAGGVWSNGYRYIGIDNKNYLAHRLIWFYHYGYFPENNIDHINRKKTDNRIENLREVSQSCNMRNCGNVSTNTSGVKGVSFEKNKKAWTVCVRIENKNHSSGQSKDFDEAVLLRYALEQCLGWGSCDKMSPAREYALKNNLICK